MLCFLQTFKGLILSQLLGYQPSVNMTSIDPLTRYLQGFYNNKTERLENICL